MKTLHMVTVSTPVDIAVRQLLLVGLLIVLIVGAFTLVAAAVTNQISLGTCLKYLGVVLGVVIVILVKFAPVL